MEINLTKTKLMFNDNTCNLPITIDNEQIEIINHFKYLVSIIDEQGSIKDILASAAQENQVCIKLKVIWNKKHIRLCYKRKLMNYIVCFYLQYLYMHAKYVR